MTNKTITLPRELAPCPFCGCAVQAITGFEYVRIKGDHAGSCVFLDDDPIIAEVAEWNTRAALTDPVPPAGVEPDRYDHAEEDMEESAFGEYVTYECYEADVTRLQAEVTQKAEALDVAKGMLQERVKQCAALQSELTKARELLREWVIQAPVHAERLISESKAVIGSTKKTEAKCNRCGADTACGKMLCEACCYEPMQAPNQSAPADKGQGGPLSELEVLRASVKELEAMRDARVDAKIAKGEPVAWLNVATGEVTTCPVVVMDWDDEKEQVQSLYAEQPAPVTAVIPERMKRRPENPAARIAYIKGWNACLDEVARLNPIKQ